jgi:hypothetical protein
MVFMLSDVLGQVKYEKSVKIYTDFSLKGLLNTGDLQMKMG